MLSFLNNRAPFSAGCAVFDITRMDLFKKRREGLHVHFAFILQIKTKRYSEKSVCLFLG